MGHTSNENKRGETKLTGTLAQNHTFTGSYLRNSTNATCVAFGAGTNIDPKTLEYPEFPNDRWVAAYRGVLSPKLFAEARFSRKAFGFRGSGGSNTDLVKGSPFWTLAEGYQYNAPYFDATDPEDRNNYQIAGSLSYFLTTQGTGSHDLKGGFEVYNSSRTGGNSQTPTGYVFDADVVQTANGEPVYDASGNLIPVWTPGETYYENWIATRGAQLDIRTTSLYIQDRWAVGRQLSFDLGVRYEKVRSEATGGIVGVDTDTWVPRLAATFDLKGDGRFVLQTTYAHYSGKYSEAQFGGNSNVGNPSVIYALYAGPVGQGLDFAPGFNLNNYEVFGGNFPTANVIFEKGLSAPITKELTASVGTQLSNRAYVKGIYVQRNMSNFVEDFIDTSNGFTYVPEVDMELTNVLYRNSDLPKRDYKALVAVGRYGFSDRWSVNGNYTLQLQGEGNFAGEGQNTPGISSMLGNYPEVFTAERNYPMGRLANFQRNKLRLWTVYNVGLSRLGNADVSLLYRYDSPLTFNYAAANVPLTSIQKALGAAYPDLPANQTLYFGERGRGEFEPQHILDLGVNYQVPVFRTLRPYVKLDVFNLLNSDPLIGFNTTVRPDPNSPKDGLGLPTGFIEGSNFGKATSVGAYPRARAFQVAVGFRF